MKIHKLIKEINNSDIESKKLLLNRPFSIHQIKDNFVNTLISITENTNFSVFTKKDTLWKIDISSDESSWNFSISLDKDFGQFIEVKNLIVHYEFSSTQLKLWISSKLYDKLIKIQVFVKTGIEYLQFERQKTEGINEYNTWYFNGPLYGNPSEDNVIVKFYLNTNAILVIKLPITNNSYCIFDQEHKVEIYRITDIPYLASTIYPIYTYLNNKFVYSDTIEKINTKETLGVKVKLNNIEDFVYSKTYLPYSYKDFPFLRTYTYDLALTMLVFLAEYRLTNQEKFKNLVINMFNTSKNLLNSKNSFNFSYPSYGYYSDEYIRNGAVAWLLEALSKSYKFINELQTEDNKNFIKTVANYLIGEIQSNGLVRGGYGIYDSQYNFDPNYVIPWYSTEHNVDTYFALKSVYEITNESIYNTKAEQIKTSIINNIYDGQKLTQGHLDTAGALDIYTWGTIFLHKINFEVNKVFKNYQHLDQYFKTRPTYTSFIPNLYKPYSSEFGYPNARNLLWFEGYFQALYTKFLIFKNDLEFREDKDKIKNFILNELLPYSVGYDEIYEIGEYPSIASIAWFLFFYYLYFNGIEAFW